jgi:hypothetical protein
MGLSDSSLHTICELVDLELCKQWTNQGLSPPTSPPSSPRSRRTLLRVPLLSIDGVTRQLLENISRDTTEFLHLQAKSDKLVKLQAVVRGWLTRRKFNLTSHQRLVALEKADIFRDLLKTERTYVRNLDSVIEVRNKKKKKKKKNSHSFSFSLLPSFFFSSFSSSSLLDVPETVSSDQRDATVIGRPGHCSDVFEHRDDCRDSQRGSGILRDGESGMASDQQSRESIHGKADSAPRHLRILCTELPECHQHDSNGHRQETQGLGSPTGTQGQIPSRRRPRSPRPPGPAPESNHQIRQSSGVVWQLRFTRHQGWRRTSYCLSHYETVLRVHWQVSLSRQGNGSFG